MAKRISAFLASLDLTASRMAIALRWLLGPVLLGILAGAGAWAALHPAKLLLVDTNKLTEPEVLKVLAWVGGGTAGIFLSLFVYAFVRRSAIGYFSFTRASTELVPRLVPLAALPFMAALALPNIERDSPKQTIFFALISAACLAYGAYAWLEGGKTDLGEPPKRSTIVGPLLAAVAVVALWAAYSALFSRLSITNHHALNSRTTDLGYYDNIFYQSIHGHPLGCSFTRGGTHSSAHFDPILIVLSPLYLLRQRTETLLVLQAIWLGAGVVPVYLIARLRGLGRPAGVALAAAFAMFPALHGANLYEFHSLSLLSTIVLWLIYFAETDRNKLYWFTFALALLTREDVPLLLCFFALYQLLVGKKGWARRGWITILLSLLYFVAVKRIFMHSTDVLNSGDKNAYSYAYYYEDLIPNKNGTLGLGLSLLTNPEFVLKHMTAEPKVMYMLLLFTPLLFAPLFSKPGRVTLVYGVLFTTLASRGPVFTVHFQYSSILIPFLFAFTPSALSRSRESGLVGHAGLDGERLQRALVVGVLVASGLISWKFGAIVDNASFRGGFGPITRALTLEQYNLYKWIDETTAKIPQGASVGTTNKMGPHVSNRKEAYFWPAEHMNVDYVFLDESELHGADLDRHTKAVQEHFTEVARNGKIALFKKK